MSDFYRPSPIKPKRVRASAEQMAGRQRLLVGIVSEMQPMTVRQVFYQATVRGLVEKDEAGYDRVQRDLVHLRRTGQIPFDWIADNTRLQRKPRSYDCPLQALEETARFYRKSLWSTSSVYVEVWIEKDALSGVVYPVTSMFDVPLMVARGYSSLSFLHSSAQFIRTLKVPAVVYHLGDFDPSGVDAANKIHQTIREYAPGAELHFESIAVTPRQIQEWNLPKRETKRSDSRSKGFAAHSVELDSINPQILRDLVQTAILRHLPREELAVLQEAERSERKLINNLAGLLQ